MDLDELTDAQLLRLFLSGRDGAYEVLMRRHEEKIFVLALRMTGNRSDALDATQDTFVAAFRKAKTFRGQASFGTWLYRIGINTCRDLIRRRNRLPEPSEIIDNPASTRIEDPVVARVDLARALDRLTEDYREALIMYELAGFSYEEIARAQKVAVGTVKSRISRARDRLASELEQTTRTQPSKETT
ncbi:MAG: sigma-70 family RNA polymerase sigma factor [Actinomycetota bacterium]|nr:sigma-70 family RNA polymerase sigma factor [Actinomycetota bacterium]